MQSHQNSASPYLGNLYSSYLFGISLGVEAGAQRMGLTHFALSVGSEAQVDALTAQLWEDGHTVLDGPRRTGDGYYESVVLDPDGNRVEITA